MKRIEDEMVEQTPVVFRMGVREFQQEVIEKLGRLEAKMDMLVGNGQPGRVTVVERKIEELVKNDVRRSVYDRLVSAAIATIISAVVALHDRFLK